VLDVGDALVRAELLWLRACTALYLFIYVLFI